MATETQLLKAAAEGENDTVRSLLEDETVDVDTTDADGNTALHLAVQNGFPEIARTLLRAECDVDKQNDLGETALLLAARRGDLETVRVLLNFGADKRIEDNNGRTPFFVAMSASHAEVANELLPGDRTSLEGTEGPSSDGFFGTTEAAGNGTSDAAEQKRLDISRREDEQHLRDAAEAGDIVGVKEILKLSPDIDIDALDDQGHTALYRATFYGRTQVVEHLLKEGADADLHDADGKTPLHVAASRGYGKIMQLLLERSRNVDVQDLLGMTPLYSAAEAGSTDVLRALLEVHADPNIPNNNEETPLWAAAANGHEAFVRLLLEGASSGGYKLDVDSPGVLRGQTPLHLAAERGDTKIAGLLLEFGAAKDARDGSGCTALFIAADMGRTRMVEFLLDLGVALDAVNQHGETALYVAALDGHVPVTQALLRRGADTELADVNGQTPLMGAAQEGHTAIIAELLKSDAKIEAANNIGETPLMIAALEGFQNAVALLIENGADTQTARNDGKTALHMAAMDGHVGALNVLLAAAEFEPRKRNDRSGKRRLVTSPLHLATDTQGDSALHLATRFRQMSIMHVLLEHDMAFRKALKESTIYGKLVAVPNKFGWTALHGAVDRAHQGAVRLLLEHKANVNAADIFGNTPVHLAARGVDHRILLKLLSQKTARMAVVNVQGRTPLHFAAACARPTSVTFLLDKGADVLAADVQKNQPLDLLGNVEACNPPNARESGLCNLESSRPDMCPITLGSKNDLVETEVLLQVAVENHNESEFCFGNCGARQAPGVMPALGQGPVSNRGTSSANGSIRLPVVGLLIPAAVLLFCIFLAIYFYFFKRRAKFREHVPPLPPRSPSSAQRFKEKKLQAEEDQVSGETSFHSPIQRKNTFDIMRAILAEPSSSHVGIPTPGSCSTDSDSSCGWSDTSDDELDHACSSGEPQHGLTCRPRGLMQYGIADKEDMSRARMWSPPMRLGSVPRIRTREVPRSSFSIRIREDVSKGQEQDTAELSSAERVGSAPIF